MSLLKDSFAMYWSGLGTYLCPKLNKKHLFSHIAHSWIYLFCKKMFILGNVQSSVTMQLGVNCTEFKATSEKIIWL